MHPVEPDTERIGATRIGIGQRPELAAVIPFLARHRAGMTTDADVEIDQQTELLLRGRWQHRHGVTFVKLTRRSNHAAWPVIGSAFA